MGKKIDLNKTVYELVKEYPELVDIMQNLGFSEVGKKAMLNSMGRLMTIPKGTKVKNITMAEVIKALEGAGFEVSGEESEGNTGKVKRESQARGSEPNSIEPENRTEKLKEYLRRLGEGEDLESVRTDFVKNFSKVDASEIMKAEQELIEEGTPLSEVQKLCDVHSALFHGKTGGEMNQKPDRAEDLLAQERIDAEIRKRDSFPKKDYSDKNAIADKLERIPGHPLHTLTEENKVLLRLIEELRSERDEELFSKIRELSIHYAKKGDLIYPHLKVQYGVSGPSDVMWTVDDEIRDEMKTLDQEDERGKGWLERVDKVLKRAEEMVYKEQNILFPICAVNFTDEEWFGIYMDSKDYASVFGVDNGNWEDAEKWNKGEDHGLNGKITMPGGQMTLPELTALLNTIPLEISFVDADNINRFFNEGPKVFKRPKMAIGREVFSCHPPKVEPMVRAIIDDFRNARRDSVAVWSEKNGRPLLVLYMAVRDKDKKYLGTVELVQDMEFAREHFEA